MTWWPSELGLRQRLSEGTGASAGSSALRMKRAKPPLALFVNSSLPSQAFNTGTSWQHTQWCYAVLQDAAPGATQVAEAKCCSSKCSLFCQSARSAYVQIRHPACLYFCCAATQVVVRPLLVMLSLQHPPGFGLKTQRTLLWIKPRPDEIVSRAVTAIIGLQRRLFTDQASQHMQHLHILFITLISL